MAYTVNEARGCWDWSGRLNGGGYGLTADNQLAHRAAYELEFGELDPVLDLHHKCHNQRCVNPKHLKPLTREAHGGLHHRRTELPPEAEGLYADGFSLRQIAEMFGVSYSTARRRLYDIEQKDERPRRPVSVGTSEGGQ